MSDWTLPQDRRAAMAEVERWGYIRPLGEDDFYALWVAPQSGFYVWLERAGEHGVLHCAIRPDLRCHVYARPFLRGLRGLVTSLRLEGLHVVTAGVALEPQVCDYLERMGFTPGKGRYSIAYAR